MRPRLSQDLGALALIVAAALAGHAFLTPLLAPLRATLGGYRAPPPPPRATETQMRAILIGGSEEQALGPFAASSLESGFSWRGDFRGLTLWGPEGLRASIPAAKIHRAPSAGGDLRSVQLDLARGDASGSWTVVREGVPTRVDVVLEPGEARVVGPFDLLLPGVTPAELEGGWLVVTMELETEDGGRGWTYAHVDRELTRSIARRAGAIHE